MPTDRELLRELKEVLGPVYFESEFNPEILDASVRTQIQASLEAADAGELTRRQLRSQLQETLGDNFAKSFADGMVVYRNGANVAFADWSEMYARTATMDAMRSAQAQFSTANDMDLARIRNDLSPCKICKPWNDKVVSISGATPGFDSLATARGKGWSHPNCGCIIIGLIPSEAEAEIAKAKLL